MSIATDLADEHEAGYGRGKAETLVACAALVRAAGCICGILRLAPGYSDSEVIEDEKGALRIKRHDSQCPQTIAAAIKARGA